MQNNNSSNNYNYKDVKIFVTNGVGRSGKDTFAEFVDEYIEEQTERRQGFNKLSSVDVAKDLAEYHGVDRNDKSDKARKFHSDLLRALETYDNSPLQSVIDTIQDLMVYEQQKYFAVDIREPYRIDKFKEMCMIQMNGAKVYTVYIVRPSVVDIKTNEGDASTYEPYEYDYNLLNDKDLDTWRNTSRNFAKFFVVGGLAVNKISTKKNTVLISGFPGVGKSYFFNQYKNYYTMLDSDSSQFSWIKDANGNNTDQRNPDFPNNYIKHIKENLGKVDVIFVSTHDTVRQALKDAGLRYYIVYPSSSYGETFDNGSRSTNKIEFLKRYKDRGSPQMFIDMMDKNWSKFIDGIIEDKYPVHITLNVDTERKWIDKKLIDDIINMETKFVDFEKGDYKYGD